MKTVGVSPGSYTLRLGGLGDSVQPPCVNDVNGPVSYGVPAYYWYETPSAWYTNQFIDPMTGQTLTPSPASPSCNCSGQPLNPYGTESELQGLRDTTPPTQISWLILIATIAGAVGGAMYGQKKGSAALYAGLGGALGGLLSTYLVTGSPVPSLPAGL